MERSDAFEAVRCLGNIALVLERCANVLSEGGIVVDDQDTG